MTSLLKIKKEALFYVQQEKFLVTQVNGHCIISLLLANTGYYVFSSNPYSSCSI